jgi:hypothetical protein
MKNTAWRKDYLVVLHSDYDDTWRDLTKPLTFMQAIRFIRARKLNAALSANRAQIVTLTQWATQFDNKEVTA